MIGFIGFGEAARLISLGLKQNGFQGIYAYHHRAHDASSDVSKKASEMEITLVGSVRELAATCRVILNVTQAKAASETAMQILPFLNADHLYVDLNSCHPDLKKEIAQGFEANGVSFIDGAIMAPVPLSMHQVPILVSGRTASTVSSLLNPLGMRVEVLEGPIGAASSVKMIRSLFMKGMAAVCIEMFVAAHLSDNVYDKVMEGLKDTFKTPFEVLFDRFLTGTVTHADRRVKEMEAAVSLVEELEIRPIMSKAALELLEAIASPITKMDQGKGEGPKQEDNMIFRLQQALWNRGTHHAGG